MPFFRKKSEKKTSPSSPKPPDASPGDRSLQNSASWVANSHLPNGDIGSRRSPVPGQHGGARPKTLPLVQAQGMELGDTGYNSNSLTAETPIRTSSRLHKTMLEIFHDKDALSYFIQYMNNNKAGHLIRFWLDAESFQAASWTRLRSRSLKVPSERSRSNSGSSPQHEGQVQGQAPQVYVGQGHTAEGQPVQGRDRTSSQKGDSEENVLNGASKTSAVPNGTENDKKSSRVTDSDLGNGSVVTRESGNGLSTNVNIVDRTEGVVDEESKSVTEDEGESVFIAAERKGSATSDSDVVASSSSQQTRLAEKLIQSIERDAVSIYAKYIALDASHPIGITDELRNNAIRRICSEDGKVDPVCFTDCQDFVLKVMERDHYQGFLQSDFHCQHQVNVLTSGKVYLSDIVYNDTALFYFMEYIEQEGAMTLIQCWLALENFQQHLASQCGKYDGIQAQADAMVLYEKYFSLQATCPLGFDDKIRFDVELNICRENGPLPDCFAVPKELVFRTIERVYFNSFVESELYFKYLSELVNTVQMAQDVPQFRRKRTGSDASSEHSVGSSSTGNDSISAKNPYLALDTSGNVLKKAIDRVRDDLRIDDSLFNPEALYDRTQPPVLSLGRMNNLGQFVSEFDPTPDHERNKGSGFFKKKKDKDKQSQEEMALQIAQMIIKDVTNVTKPEHLLLEEEEAEEG